MFTSSSRKPNHSFTALNPSVAPCPDCNGKRRAHTYKDGYKKASPSDIPDEKKVKPTDIPVETKPEKKIASGDAKIDPPKLTTPPPTFRRKEKSPDFGIPFEHFSIPSSSSGAKKNPDAPAPEEPEKPEPQEEKQDEVEPEPTIERRREERSQGFHDFAVGFAENS